MNTNLSDDDVQELREKGQELINAARAFWEIHHQLGGPKAVVWLESTDGSLVVFTRGEYREQIMKNIAPLSEEIPLTDPFIDPPKTP